jgi:two-component system sensor histidine kinase/response regulator
MTEDESNYPPASILVVDDQPANLLAVGALLRSLGHAIVTAASGQEALRAVETREFAVILMDVHMPILDGFETVARLRREQPTVQTPVVFLSAVYDQPLHVQRGYALGAVDYLPRPTDPDLLRAKVASFVSLYRRGQELRRRARIIEEQTAAATRAQAASRLKDVYLAVIGHDLRNPLSVVGMVAAQLRRGPDADAARTLADRLERVVRRSDTIVGNLLDFTRGELGDGIAVNPVPADLGDIARAVVHEMTLLHPDREIRLELSGNLAGAWDVHRAEQVLTNLLQNAIHHGGGAVAVAVTAAEESVVVDVHNDGAIAGDLLPSIFEPFRRGAGKSGGLGLGLYIVREILRAHGGAVRVVSSPEHGTTFTSTWRRGC